MGIAILYLAQIAGLYLLFHRQMILVVALVKVHHQQHTRFLTGVNYLLAARYGYIQRLERVAISSLTEDESVFYIDNVTCALEQH